MCAEELGAWVVGVQQWIRVDRKQGKVGCLEGQIHCPNEGNVAKSTGLSEESFLRVVGGRLHVNFQGACKIEVFTAVTMKNAIFWDVMLCVSCKNRRFGGMYCHHHQGNKNQRARNNVSSN
jgi:hypothetical protein